MEQELKTKCMFKTTDDLWSKLRTAHRRKYSDDKNNMNLALTRALEEFIE